eukprot:GFUD01137842.1.p1 GENE.GFUD01137842.1~~GFUD01137842.1.p1  ORF type:complete len:698 (+),score=190.83 GFUD01137842.1:270-2096(+)
MDQETKDRERRDRIEQYEKDKAEQLATKQKEEEEKALEDERKRLLEIEAEKKAKIAEEEKRQLEQLKIEEEKALKRKIEEEAEWKKFEEERLENNNAGTISDSIETVTTVPSDKSEEETGNEEFTTPPQEVAEELSSSQIQVKGTQSAQTAQNLQINFSDFEALSDPFADLELKTINDLAELQTILTSNHASVAQPFSSQNNYLPNSNSVISHPQSHQASPGPLSQTNHSSSQNFSPGQYQQPGSHSTFYSSVPRQSPSQALNQSQFNHMASPLAHPTPNHSNFANFSTFNSTANAYSHQTPTCTTNAYIHQTQNPAGNQFFPNYTSNPFGASVTSSTQAFTGSNNTTGYSMSGSTNTGYVNSSSPSYNIYNPGLAPPTYQPRLQDPAPNTYETRGSRSVSSDRRTEKLKDSSDEPSSGELKPSRSVGDMITELQKEAQALQEQKRKSMSSPNPTSRPASRGATGLENWVPWPMLDQEQSKAPPKQKSVEVDDSCLNNLMDDEANICRQLHEMGFPLPRLAKGCQAVGSNSQKLINFCLVVDRLVDEGFSIADSEEVAVLHNAQEDVCRTHLKSFQQLAEIGFPSKDVHEALIASSFDHQKALEQLIR